MTLKDISSKAYDLANTIEFIVDPALNFIEDRNNSSLNFNNLPSNLQQDYSIIRIIEGFGIQNTLYTDKINNVKLLLQSIGPEALHQPPPPPVNIPGYSNIELKMIDESTVKITHMSIFARRTDAFQVAVHKGIYNNKEVAIKMYEAISATASFDKVHTEIRCYQFLSALRNEFNCFLEYHGTYYKGHAAYLVMEWQE